MNKVSGRRSLPGGSVPVCVYLAVGEHRMIAAHARQSRTSVSQFLREAASLALVQILKSPYNPDVDFQLTKYTVCAGVDLSQFIRKMRHTLGITQIELAQALGCSGGMVYQWETGRPVLERWFPMLYDFIEHNFSEFHEKVLHKIEVGKGFELE